MSTVMLFYAGMALIISIIFYVGFRFEKKNAWRREETDQENDKDPLDPNKL